MHMPTRLSGPGIWEGQPGPHSDGVEGRKKDVPMHGMRERERGAGVSMKLSRSALPPGDRTLLDIALALVGAVMALVAMIGLERALR